MSADRGPWAQTFSGRQFFPLDPRPDEIDHVDIAHALSMLCRYNGSVRRFYSVAEHCVLMSEAVAPENALWALLHDATEAYVGDMIRPLKQHMTAYREIEDHLMGVIAQRFDLAGSMPTEVRAADSRILLDERAELLLPSPADWNLGDLEPLGVRISGWEPTEARRRYLTRLLELTENR